MIKIMQSWKQRKVFVSSNALWIMAGVFSLSVTTGFFLDHGMPFESMSGQELLIYAAFVCVLIPLCKCLFTWAYVLIEKWAYKEIKCENSRVGECGTYMRTFLVIMLCWIPVWLAYYPGLWNYDPGQVVQYLNGNFSKFHPLIHTLLLGFCYSVGWKHSDNNMGVILYDFIQMFIMAGIFAYVCTWIRRQVRCRAYYILTVFFFAIFPVNSIMVLSTTKDVIFSGLVQLNLVMATQYYDNMSDNNTAKRYVLVLLMGSVTLMLLFRNNAIYAFFLFMIIGVIYTRRQKESVRIILFMICCLAVYYISDVCLTKALSADDGSIQEALSVPSQQFGRIYTVACANGDEESKELIEAYYTEMTTERYNPHLSDSMKGHLVNVESAAKVLEYFRTAGKLLVKYPLVSLDSFLYLTEGGWYINDTSCAAIYGTGLETRQGYLLTDVKDRFGTIEFGIVHQSRFPLLENVLEHAFSNNEYQKIPILSVLFAPALYFWILAFCMVGLYYARNVRYLYLTGFLGILYLTVLAGPCIIVRYMYPFIVYSPVLLAMLVKSVRVCYMNKEYIDGVEV